MLTLHQMEISPFCDKIRRILNVKRVPYRTREVTLLESQLGYRKVNPAGKVPALTDESGTTICDSTDIAYWIEERWPEPPLLPRDPRERALVHVFEDWADESLYFYEVALRFGLPHNRARTLPRLLANDGAAMQAIAPWMLPRAILGQLKGQGIGRKSDAQVLQDLRRHLDALVALLDGRTFLVGEALTLADVAVFAQLFAVFDSTEGAAERATRPALAAYMTRIDQATRPAAGSVAA